MLDTNITGFWMVLTPWTVDTSLYPFLLHSEFCEIQRPSECIGVSVRKSLEENVLIIGLKGNQTTIN